MVAMADTWALSRDNDTIILYMDGKEIGRVAVGESIGSCIQRMERSI